MPRLSYRAAARRDLADIAIYIDQETGSQAAAETFIDKLTAYCEHLSTLRAPMGRARPDLHADYRSVTYGKYVIFLRYTNEDGPLSHLYIGNVIPGRRDLAAYSAKHAFDDDD